MLRIAQPDVPPCLSAVGGLVHAVAVGQVRTEVGFARTDIDHVGIRGRDGESTDRRDRLTVKDRLPGFASIGRLPYASADRAEVIDIGLAGDTGDGVAASTTERPDHPPAQSAVKTGIE